MLYQIITGLRQAGRRCSDSLHPELFVAVGFALVLAFSGIAVHKSADAARRAQVALRVTRAQVVAVDKKLCDIAVPSWNLRQQLIIDVTAPSKVSAEILRNTPARAAIESQVRAANARRKAQRERNLKLNGARPQC